MVQSPVAVQSRGGAFNTYLLLVSGRPTVDIQVTQINLDDSQKWFLFTSSVGEGYASEDVLN